jgi:hypothetical protein
MSVSPVEAAIYGWRSLSERLERLPPEALPVEVAVDALCGRQFQSLVLGGIPIEVIDMDKGRVDPFSHRCRQSRLADTTMTVQRDDNRSVHGAVLQSAYKVRNLLGGFHGWPIVPEAGARTSTRGFATLRGSGVNKPDWQLMNRREPAPKIQHPVSAGSGSYGPRHPRSKITGAWAGQSPWARRAGPGRGDRSDRGLSGDGIRCYRQASLSTRLRSPVIPSTGHLLPRCRHGAEDLFHVVDHEPVALTGALMESGVGGLPRYDLSLYEWNVAVQVAMPDVHRYLDVLKPEAPVTDASGHVLDRSPSYVRRERCRLFHKLSTDVRSPRDLQIARRKHPTEAIKTSFGIATAETQCDCHDRGQQPPEGRRQHIEPPRPVRVGRPLNAVGQEHLLGAAGMPWRCHSARHRTADETVREEPGAGQGVGPTGGMPQDGECLYTQVIGELEDVAGEVRQSSSRLVGAVSVAGAVKGDEPDAAVPSDGVVDGELMAPTRAAVESEHGHSLGITRLDPGEVSAVGEFHNDRVAHVTTVSGGERTPQAQISGPRESVWPQPVDATASLNAWDGDIQPSVCRGRPLSERAMALSSTWVTAERSVVLGRY